MKRRDHWEHVFATRQEDEVSWFQPTPETSLRLIAATGIEQEARILDVGGGASRLVDHLIAAGHRQVAVLDVAAQGLELAKSRLGERAALVEWIVADVTQYQPTSRCALWHDRAVFHFLVDAADRAAYRAALERSLIPGGHAIIATFGPGGPERCSGLPVVRYSAQKLGTELGTVFYLQATELEVHRTPGGVDQEFVYCHFRRRA